MQTQLCRTPEVHNQHCEEQNLQYQKYTVKEKMQAQLYRTPEVHNYNITRNRIYSIRNIKEKIQAQLRRTAEVHNQHCEEQDLQYQKYKRKDIGSIVQDS